MFFGDFCDSALAFNPFFSTLKPQCKGMTYAMCWRCWDGAIGIHDEKIPFASVRASGGAVSRTGA